MAKCIHRLEHLNADRNPFDLIVRWIAILPSGLQRHSQQSPPSPEVELQLELLASLPSPRATASLPLPSAKTSLPLLSAKALRVPSEMACPGGEPA
jgi:hypothetical protein